MAESEEGFQGRRGLSPPAVSAPANAQEDARVMYLQPPNQSQALSCTDEEAEMEVQVTPKSGAGPSMEPRPSRSLVLGSPAT